MSKYKIKFWETLKGSRNCFSKENVGMNDNRDKIQLIINGKTLNIFPGDISSSTKLARYIREQLFLTGTKISCDRGGCGSCTVIVVSKNGKKINATVNSCLIPVAICDGWEILTIEGLKNFDTSDRLAHYNGSQCGFCSVGMVMLMEGLRMSNKQLTSKDAERGMDGNICRCTGYRPILDAFKSFTVDNVGCVRACNESSIKDIEDIVVPRNSNERLRVMLSDGVQWIKPLNLEDLIATISSLTGTYKLISGNQNEGICDDDGIYDVMIDVTNVENLTTHSITSDSITLGGGMTIDSFIEELKVQENTFTFASHVVEHLLEVGSTNVRNMGSLAGNLMMKHQFPDFQSDIFILFAALNGVITVINAENNSRRDLTLVEFLNTSMRKSILLHITLKNLDSDDHFYSYKVTKRRRNTKAYVNGAFRMKIQDSKIVGISNLVYGGITGNFFRATETEKFLENKLITDETVLRNACETLEREISDDNSEYSKYLAQALLYKFWLRCTKDVIPTPLVSGGSPLSVPELSRGTQTYTTDPNLYPLNEPIMKLEALNQCKGQAEFVNDIQTTAQGDYYGAFVTSTLANCQLESIDVSHALNTPGVVSFVDHRDIVGKNEFAPGEEVFSSGTIHYAGQSIGLVIATSYEAAQRGAKAVQVYYKNAKKPYLTIEDVLLTNDESRISKLSERTLGAYQTDDINEEETEETDDPNTVIVKGKFKMGSQYHFHMETQTCIVKPLEDKRFLVFASTQNMDDVQQAISNVLKVRLHNITVQVRRLGGGFGAKISRTNLVAAAAAVAANKTKRTVRIVLDFKTNMQMMGKRLPYMAIYKASMNKNTGKLKNMFVKVYCNSGCSFNESTVEYSSLYVQNVYVAEAWKIVPAAVLTNTPSNTYCRAPGSTQGIGIIESIMDHLAIKFNFNPTDFRLRNMINAGDSFVEGEKLVEENPLPQIIEKLKISGQYDSRVKAVEEFNKNNFWKKRGISLNPSVYHHNYFNSARFYAQVAIYAADGSVSVSVGGIEMGQGLNTKVAQVVAKQFKISMDKIKVEPSTTFISPNNSTTAGSMGSESTASAAEIACGIILARMKPIKDKMEDPNDWNKLIHLCYKNNIDLSARHMGNPSNDKLKSYKIWGAVITEVEIDILTGETYIVRSDLAQDTGTTMNPEIDIGQVEGAFTLGIGLYTTEELQYDTKTGRLLSCSPWNYTPPSNKDIPQDMRTTLYDKRKNPFGVLGSKATGEPSVVLSCSVLSAIRYALVEIRKQFKDNNHWVVLNSPATPEAIQKASRITPQFFTLHIQ